MHWLPRTALLIGLGAALAAPSAADNPPLFYSKPTGFQIKRPVGWSYLGDAEALNKKVPRRLSDAELDKLLGARKALDLVQIALHREPFDGLNPSIQVAFHRLESLASASPIDALAPIAAQLKQQFPDLEVIDAPQSATIGGRPGARMKARYTATLDGKSYPTLSRIWIAPRGDFAFVIGMSGPATGPEVSEAHFASCLASIRIMK